MLEIYSIDNDTVIGAAVGQGKASYKYALDSIYPLINRLDIQRKVQDPKFYDRLKRDILNGCIMPAITIAFIEDDMNAIKSMDVKGLRTYINNNIHNGFVLDGIQRLNTIHRAASEADSRFPYENPIFFAVLICNSMDSLLYRMITLNNGQRPMTTRHQIEILTSNLIDFSDTPLLIKTEKSIPRRKGYFKQADFVVAYLAFLSNSTTIDNQKLIEDKLDQLVAFKILETDITKAPIQFTNVLDLIHKLCVDKENKEWFKNVNNLVGFCSAIRKSFDSINDIDAQEFKAIREEFEKAFSSFSPSKIKVGQYRRNAVSLMVGNFNEFRNLNHLEMLEQLAAQI